MRETTNLCVEIMNSKRQVMGETWSRGTNSRLPFDVNVMLNLSIVTEINQSINLCQYVGWGCPDHWSWKLMYETYDNKNTKLIIIQYISIKII